MNGRENMDLVQAYVELRRLASIGLFGYQVVTFGDVYVISRETWFVEV